jgi:hypothetical protein
MSKFNSVALIGFAAVVSFAAYAEKGDSKASGQMAPTADKRDMPANDDFQSVTFRAGGGGSSPSCCPADFNCDGVVDAADLTTMLGGWGLGGQTDVTGNGTTDGSDLAVLLGSWGACAG